MDQEDYDEDNPNLDGDYKAVLRIRKLKAQKEVIDSVDGPAVDKISSMRKVQAAPSALQLPAAAAPPPRRTSRESLRVALFLAAESDDIETLRGYISDNKRIDKPLTDSRYRDTETGETVLHRALNRRSFNAATFLLTTEHAAALARAVYDVLVSGEVDKRTCLHQATEAGRLDILRTLLAALSDQAERAALLRKETLYLPNGRRPRNVTCLHIAAMKGFTDVVEYLVSECGVDVNQANEQKDTALMWASLEGHATTVDMLVSLRADVSAKNDQGSTALHYAIRSGHVDVAQLLIASGRADVNSRRRRGLVCPLVLAATMGFEDIVRLLLKSGADVNTLIHGSETALHYAAGEGHIGVCQALIEAGVEIDAEDSRGETALIEAALHGEVELVDYLLSKGANSNHQTVDRRSVWTYAVEAADNRMLRVLLAHVSRTGAAASEKGAFFAGASSREGDIGTVSMLSMRFGNRVHLPDGIEPLHLAAARGDAAKLRLMLSSQLYSEARDSRGNTFVHAAAAANRWQILDEFAVGQLASAVNDEGNTPLHEACRLAYIDSVRVLIGRTKLRERNKSDRTALHEASRSSNGAKRSSPASAVVRLVIAQIQQGHYWELLDAQDERGYTALHWAVKVGNRAALHELRSLSLHVQDEDGNTPLHLAATAGDADTFAELLRLHPGKSQQRHCEELEVSNASGMTVLRMAVYHNSTTIIEQAVRAGADVAAVGRDGQTLLHWIADLIKADASMVKIYMQAVRVITDLGVPWWTLKTKRATPAHSSIAYENMRCDALRMLFGTLANSSDFTVLQHSAKIGCVPMVEYILSLKNVYKFKVGKVLEYDVTDMTPETVVLQAERLNKVHPATVMSVYAEKPATLEDYSEKHHSVIDAEGIAVTTNSQDSSSDGSQPPPASLLELIVSNEERLSAAAVLSVHPISDMVRNYWSTYQWLYAACMLLHLAYMVLLTAYAPQLQKNARLGFNFTEILKSGQKTINCTSLQPSLLSQYILISEPAILLFIQFLQLLSLAWRRRVAGRSKTCCSSAPSDPKGTIAIALLALCGTVFAMSTLAWLGMFRYCFVNQDYVLAFALLFGWIFPLNFTSGFEALHQFSLMLRHMIFEDIVRFLTVYAFVLCGCGFAQHVIVESFENYSDYRIQDTLFTTFQWLVGMNSFWDKPAYSDDELYNRYGFLAALYIFYTIMSTIILINLLIAMMSDSYTGVKNHSAMLWKVASIELALNTQKSLSPLQSVLKRIRSSFSAGNRALRYDAERRRWRFRVAKARRVGPKKKEISDADPTTVQLSQKVSSLQEQLDSINNSLKQLLPNTPEDKSPSVALRRIENVAKVTWKKAVGRMADASPPQIGIAQSTAQPTH